MELGESEGDLAAARPLLCKSVNGQRTQLRLSARDPSDGFMDGARWMDGSGDGSFAAQPSIFGTAEREKRKAKLSD